MGITKSKIHLNNFLPCAFVTPKEVSGICIVPCLCEERLHYFMKIGTRISRLEMRLTRRVSRVSWLTLAQGNGSKSFRGKPFFLLLLRSWLLRTLRNEGITTAVFTGFQHKGVRHILQFFPNGNYQILEKVLNYGTNILLQSNMNSDLSS